MATLLLTTRTARKMSLRQLGRLVGVSAGQLSRLERGQTRPSVRTAERLFEVFEGALTREQIMFPEDYVQQGGKKPAASAVPEAR